MAFDKAAYMKEWRAKNRERIRAYQKEYGKRHYQENRERYVEWSRSAYERNRDKAIARSVQWREDNIEKRREWERVNARRRLLGDDEHSRDYGEILRLDPCSYCGAPAEAVDHIEPMAEGGDNHWTNFTAACKACNSSKHTRSLLLHLHRTAT